MSTLQNPNDIEWLSREQRETHRFSCSEEVSATFKLYEKENKHDTNVCMA